MTPEEAAICLRDDPTFATSSPEEQATEAALLLGSDDPLDIALAVELALQSAPTAIMVSAPGDEGCRLETPCRVPRLAGNGRCLDCGASRSIAEPAAESPVKTLSAAEAVKAGPPKPRPPSDLRRGVKHDPTTSYLGRFKEATGATDQEMSELLGVSRASVQAYIAGRRTELLDDAQTRSLMTMLEEHMLLAATLKRDLAVTIGEAHPD